MSSQQLPAGIAPVRLRAGAVVLRAPSLRDVPAVTAACQDPEVARWTTVPSPYTAADAAHWVTGLSDAQWADGTGATWLVTDPGDHAVLGACSLTGISRHHARAEVGYWVAAPARGGGVATAAVRLACRWAFGQAGLVRVDWRALVPNHASRRVAERCGFTVEGTLRSAVVHRGERRDEWFGGLLAGELRDAPAPSGPTRPSGPTPPSGPTIR